jgi:hypothetical protein
MGSDRLAAGSVSFVIARRLSTAGVLGVGLASMAACGDPPPTTRNDGGPPPPTPVAVQNIAAYEGQQAFVTVLESGGDDWSSATVTSSTSALEVVAQRCNATLCAVVARVPDTARNTGQSIPAPIDAQRSFLVVDAPAGDSQGLVSVFPTDALSAPGGETMVAGNYFAASVNAATGSVLRAGGAEPIHWVVFGNAQIDVFDVSARGSSPGAGGHAGGAAGAPGEGPGGGAAAYDMVGAGGGASFEDGGLGAMATEAARAADPSCATDFFATECGGSGGGGAAGEGGAGGGSVTLVVLGSACIRTVRGLGGDAASGSGGGGGGGALAFVTASVLDCDPTAEVAGGAGDGTGGAGGDGHVFVGGVEAPRIAFDTSGLITSDPSYLLVGGGPAGQLIRIERVTDSGAEPVTEAMSGSDGSFSIPVDLVPGINRLREVDVPFGVVNINDGKLKGHVENRHGVSPSSTNTFTRPAPSRRAASIASTVRAFSAEPTRMRSCVTSRRAPWRRWMRA